jgi:hypothetical protein
MVIIKKFNKHFVLPHPQPHGFARPGSSLALFDSEFCTPSIPPGSAPCFLALKKQTVADLPLARISLVGLIRNWPDSSPNAEYSHNPFMKIFFYQEKLKI